MIWLCLQYPNCRGVRFIQGRLHADWHWDDPSRFRFWNSDNRLRYDKRRWCISAISRWQSSTVGTARITVGISLWTTTAVTKLTESITTGGQIRKYAIWCFRTRLRIVPSTVSKSHFYLDTWYMLEVLGSQKRYHPTKWRTSWSKLAWSIIMSGRTLGINFYKYVSEGSATDFLCTAVKSGVVIPTWF